MIWRLLDIRVGRMNRRQFILLNFVFILLSSSLKDVYLSLEQNDVSIQLLLFLAFGLALNYLSFVFVARRIRDIGYSGKYSLIFLSAFGLVVFENAMPHWLYYAFSVAGLLLLILISFSVGAPGKNKYGPKPRGFNLLSGMPEK
ncbi:MAG: DUF805 domain-containing protein [Alphaproteobacteria bacterium]|nr:DUF805 domain-containing protein [Alphaproteobacteria bacterium]